MNPAAQLESNPPTTPGLPVLLVITVSTRPERSGPLVAEWFTELASTQGGFEVRIADLARLNLPLLDEPHHPRLADYQQEHTRNWSRMVAEADAYVFVTPEYDYATPAALINALQYLFTEWHYKPVGLVSYGGISGGLRGVQMTKQVVTTLRMMPIPEGVVFPFFAQWVNAATGKFEPGRESEVAADQMLKELRRWSDALTGLREVRQL